MGWGLAGVLLEAAAKVVDTGKTTFLRNRGDSKRSVNKHLPGFADPDIQNILPGRSVIVGPEQLSQIHLADTDVFGKHHIGKCGVLYMVVYIFHDDMQQIRNLLSRGNKVVQQIVKGTENSQLAFAAQKLLLQSLKPLYAALRIVQGENGYFFAIQACAGKINNGKQAFFVTGKAVRAALGQKDGITLVADIGFSIHCVCDLTAHTKG